MDAMIYLSKRSIVIKYRIVVSYLLAVTLDSIKKCSIKIPIDSFLATAFFHVSKTEIELERRSVGCRVETYLRFLLKSSYFYIKKFF